MMALEEHRRRKSYYAIDLGACEFSHLSEICSELISMPEGEDSICAAIIDALSRKDILRADVLHRFVHPSILNIIAKQNYFIENNYENTLAAEWFLKNAHPFVSTYIPTIRGCKTSPLGLAKWVRSKKLRTEGLRTVTSDDLMHRKKEITEMLTWLKANDTYPLDALSLMTQACRTGKQETVLEIEQICGEITSPHRIKLALISIGHGSVEFVKWILRKYGIEIKQITDQEIVYSLTSNTKAETVNWLIAESIIGQKHIEKYMEKAICENNLEVAKTLHRYFSKEEMEHLAEKIQFPGAMMRWIVEHYGFDIFTPHHLTRLAVKADDLTTALQIADEAKKRFRPRLDALALMSIARMDLTAQEIVMLLSKLGATGDEKRILVKYAAGAGREDIVKEVAKHLGTQDKQVSSIHAYLWGIAGGIDMLETLYNAGFAGPLDILYLDGQPNPLSTLNKDTLPLDWLMEKFEIESIGPVNPDLINQAAHMEEGNYALLRWMQKWHAKSNPASLKEILEILRSGKLYKEAELAITGKYPCRKTRERWNADERP